MGYRQPKVIKLSKHKNYLEIKRLYDEIDRLDKTLKKVKKCWQTGMDACTSAGSMGTFEDFTEETEDEKIWYGEMKEILKDVYPKDLMEK
jgi:hypothetical protein